MPKDTPSAFDFLFRRGQTFWGTQQGNRDQMQFDALEQEKAQTELLKDMAAQQRETAKMVEQQSNIAAAEPYQPPYIEVLPPEINIAGLADELAPEFDNLADAQRELAGKVTRLGYLGQLILSESEIQTNVLNSLDDQGREAYGQREKALNRMAEGIRQQRLSNNHLSNIDRGIEGVQRSIGLSTAILSSSIYDLKDSLSSALGDLGEDIRGLTDEVIQTRLEVIQTLQDSQSIFLWSHREQMWVRQQTLDVLRNPARTAAREAWQIGERCRQAGDENQALRMYMRSLQQNPAEARNYVSVGLMSLDRGDADQARMYFSRGAKYADEPSLKATTLSYLGKVDMFDKQFDRARQTLEIAKNTDVTNLEVWFDLAICEMKSGNREDALYYIRNLLMVPTRLRGARAKAAAQYALKIVAEQAFQPLLPDIYGIMREIINNCR